MGAAVEATGEFHIGDRVAAFHRMMTTGGAYAEYAVAPAHTAFTLPKGITFEGLDHTIRLFVYASISDDFLYFVILEAATIPLVTLTAALALFRRHSLPPPWSPRAPNAPPVPLIIYGASSALGSFAIKLAKAANIHPIIAICGASQGYVSGILESSKGDVIVDYRNGVEAMMAAVKEALGPLKVRHALDAITSKGTWIPVTQMVDPKDGQVSVFSGANRYDEAEIPVGVRLTYTYVGTVHSGCYRPGAPKQPMDAEEVKNDVEFAYVLLRYISRMLARGKFEGHPVEIIPEGLNGVQTGLRKLKNGEARGVKFVYRIGDTQRLVAQR